jgi:hypothetical protein
MQDGQNTLLLYETIMAEETGTWVYEVQEIIFKTCFNFFLKTRISPTTMQNNSASPALVN